MSFSKKKRIYSFAPSKVSQARANNVSPAPGRSAHHTSKNPQESAFASCCTISVHTDPAAGLVENLCSTDSSARVVRADETLTAAALVLEDVTPTVAALVPADVTPTAAALVLMDVTHTGETLAQEEGFPLVAVLAVVGSPRDLLGSRAHLFPVVAEAAAAAQTGTRACRQSLLAQMLSG